MNAYPYVLQRITQSLWKIHLSVTEKSNRKQNHINVRLYNYAITTCSQSYNDNVKIWCSKCPPFARIQYYSPMKSGVSADSSSATILRAWWAGALSCWNAKKGPDIERMAGKISGYQNIRLLYVNMVAHSFHLLFHVIFKNFYASFKNYVN